MMHFDYAGKTVLITGGSQGIGLGIGLQRSRKAARPSL